MIYRTGNETFWVEDIAFFQKAYDDIMIVFKYSWWNHDHGEWELVIVLEELEAAKVMDAWLRLKERKEREEKRI